MVIAILLYPGVTALDAVGPYEVLHRFRRRVRRRLRRAAA